MKDKMLMLIIGILIGAIIASVGFLIYEKNTKANIQETITIRENGQRGMPPQGENEQQPFGKSTQNMQQSVENSNI